MNTLLWGTCNTDIGTNQCIANMGWFASALNTACKDDLRDNNALAVDTLMGESSCHISVILTLNAKNYICHRVPIQSHRIYLFCSTSVIAPLGPLWIALNAFQLMFNAACAMDPQANTYCYIDAVANTSPADLYLYQLPIGIDLPDKTTNFSCSPCSQGLLSLYAQHLSNSTLDDPLTGLKETYETSANVVNAACGTNFAETGVSSGALALSLSHGIGIVFAAVLGVWTLIL
jgi:hypothetical protein